MVISRRDLLDLVNGFEKDDGYGLRRVGQGVTRDRVLKLLHMSQHLSVDFNISVETIGDAKLAKFIRAEGEELAFSCQEQGVIFAKGYRVDHVAQIEASRHTKLPLIFTFLLLSEVFTEAVSLTLWVSEYRHSSICRDL